MYLSFWIWGIYHAASTPKAHPTQKMFWVGAMLVNPSTIIWYWYVWKRWIFWLLFTPLFAAVCAFPFFTTSILSPDKAIVVFGIMILFLFPIIFRLAAVLHIGRNSELDALRRNDWVVCLAFPILGFGVSMIYATRYMRTWALISLLWWLAAGVSTYIFIARLIEIINV